MVLTNLNYFVALFIMCLGLYAVSTSRDYMKRLFGMAVFQAAVLLFYISLGFIKHSNIPIITVDTVLYTNPIPHVLMLTAIVVGVATLSVGLAIVIRINRLDKVLDKSEQ